MQQEHPSFQSFFFHFFICWCSGLFSPEFESNTKYCLERGLESSVRLCLTSWLSPPLLTWCTCPRVCELPRGTGKLHAWLAEWESRDTCNCAQQGATPPTGDRGTAATMSRRRGNRDVWLRSIHRAEGARRCRVQVFESGDGSLLNPSLFCHKSSEQQLHLQPTLPEWAPTVQDGGQPLTRSLLFSACLRSLLADRGLGQDANCDALWCFVLILLSGWML